MNDILQTSSTNATATSGLADKILGPVTLKHQLDLSPSTINMGLIILGVIVIVVGLITLRKA